jgi:perosamine synthetase
MTPPTVQATIPIAAPVIGEAEKQAVLEVLESGMLVQGPRVAELERRFAQQVGARHAVATNSGTAALHLALIANGIGAGDEVITSPFTFVASANAILYVGARPVFVDIEEDTFNIDAGQIEAAITPRTRAIMPIHLFGHPAPMDEIVELADRRGLRLIEDCAQSIGATHHGRATGTFGTGCFSLYATKNVTSGEGGIVTTDDDEIADTVRLLRSHGMRQRYHYERLGYNFRLSDLHAAIGICQLDRLPESSSRRTTNAQRLSQAITSVRVPRVRPGCVHAWHQFTIRIDGQRDRDAANAQLNAAGIGTGIFYPAPVHMFPHVVEAAGEFELPMAEKASREVISIPVHPSLSESDVDRIAQEVNRL